MLALALPVFAILPAPIPIGMLRFRSAMIHAGSRWPTTLTCAAPAIVAFEAWFGIAAWRDTRDPGFGAYAAQGDQPSRWPC